MARHRAPDQQKTDPVAHPVVGHLQELLGAMQADAGALSSVPDQLDLTAEQREGLYLLAHRHYGVGDYPEAHKLFALLAMAAPADPRGHMGLAACLQMQQEHERAVRHYFLASVLDLTDPVPVVHSAECLMALGRTADAAKALNCAQQQLANRPDLQDYRHRVHRLRAGLTPPPAA